MFSKMTLAVSRALTKEFKHQVMMECAQTEPVKKPRRIVKMEEDEPIKKPRRIVVMEEDLPTCYTKEQVAAMDRFTILAEFIRITGKDTLPCKHCAKKEKSVLTDWTHSIYVRALKVGLSATMKLPKTCDTMQARNRVCNPVNNPVYSLVHSKDCEIEDKAEALRLRQELLESIHLKTRPYRYIA